MFFFEIDTQSVRKKRNGLTEVIKENGICGYIEPLVDFDSIGIQLSISEQYAPYTRIAIGVYPTRCFLTSWKNRNRLYGYAIGDNVVAIGETGLDYYFPRMKQHRIMQIKWFIYQIMLADRLQLPLILISDKRTHSH